MAEEDTPAAPALDYSQLPALLEKLGLTPPAPPQLPSSPGQGGVAGFLGDVGKVLAGGGSGLLDLPPGESDKAGAHALLNAGINMLMASGPSYVPRGLGQIIGYGLQGAQEGYQGSELAVAQRLAAQQAGQQQQFTNRMEAIKAALPLLRTQQLANLPNPLAGGGGGKPNTSIAAAIPAYGGASNPPPMPKEYEAYFQEASKATGIPVDVLKAQAAQESGFNPGATGAAGEIGIMQIHPDTAKNPGFGLEGVRNPAELRDPRSNIMFGAKYLAARGKGQDFTTPQGQAAALKAYNGGGDPNYVANVFRYMPAGGATQVAAATPPPAAPGGGTAAPAPGRVQVAKADTGTKTDATPAPVPVGDHGLVRNPDGTVGTPNAGGLGTGGAAATTPPAAAPPPPPFPGYMSYADWQKTHPVTVDPALYTVPGPTAEAVADAQKEKAAATQSLSINPGDPKAIERYTVASQNLATLQQNAAAKSVELRGKAQEAAGNQDRQVYDAEMARLKEISEGDKNRQAQIALKTQEGQQAIQLEAAKSDNAFTLDTRKKLTDERNAAQENVDGLAVLDQLSRAAGEATPLDALSFGGKPLRQWLLERHIGTDDQIAHWGAQQAYEAAINQTVIGLRKGVSMGQLSDRDLSFLSGMSPTVLEKPATRDAITAYLRQSQLRKIRFVDTVDELWAGGKGMSYGDALREARKSLPEIVPRVPSGLTNADKRAWFTGNVPPGTLYRNSQGDLTVWPGMPGS